MTQLITDTFRARHDQIDLTAPGGVEALLAFHRRYFGDARMEAEVDQTAPGADEQAGADGHTDDNADQTPDAAEDERLGDAGKRALQKERRENKTLRQERDALQQQLKDLEDKGKSDEERRTERLAELEKTAATAEQTIADKDNLILRYQIAAEKGLDLAAAERLRGTDREEIEADADDWIKRWGKAEPTPQRRNLPDPGQGARQKSAEDPWEAGYARARSRFGTED